MSSFLIELWSAEKSCTVPFKEISFCSSFVKFFDMLPKEYLYQLILLLASNLCFIHIQVTLITIVMQN